MWQAEADTELTMSASPATAVGQLTLTMANWRYCMVFYFPFVSRATNSVVFLHLELWGKKGLDISLDLTLYGTFGNNDTTWSNLGAKTSSLTNFKKPGDSLLENTKKIPKIHVGKYY